MSIPICSVTRDSNLRSDMHPRPSTPGPKTSWPPGSLCCPALAKHLGGPKVGLALVLRLLRRLRTDLNEIQRHFSREISRIIKFFVVWRLIWAVYSLSTRFPLDWGAGKRNSASGRHFGAELPNEPQNLSLCYLRPLEQFRSLRSPPATYFHLVPQHHVATTLA